MRGSAWEPSASWGSAESRDGMWRFGKVFGGSGARVRVRSVWVALAVAATMGQACESPPESAGSGGWAGTFDTLRTGRIVVANPDRPLLDDSTACLLEERLRVGALDSDGPDMFGEVRDVALSDGGELYVLDGQSSEVRAFDADGLYRLTMGRLGEGPGELNRPAGMALDSRGVLWVMNWSNARYTAFDPASGEVVREARRLASFTSFPWPGLVDDEFRIVDVGLDRDGEPAILRLDTEFIPSDTIRLPQPRPEDVVTFRRDGLTVMSMPDPFAARVSWAPRPRGGIVVGEGAEYRLHRIDFDGDTSMTIEVLREPTHVTASERDSALAAFHEGAAMGGGATPDRDPRVRDTKPAHGSIFVDDEDRIWVRRTPEVGVPPAWDVIDARGRLLCRMTAPQLPGSRIDVRGGRLAVVSEPEGVPTVTVYDIVGAAP